jgi:hypothetical protein
VRDRGGRLDGRERDGARPGEGGGDVAGSGPVGGVAPEAGRQYRHQSRGHAAQVRVEVQHPVEHHGRVALAERRAAGGGIEQHAAEGEDVRLRPRGAVRDLLGRDEAGRADDGAGPRQRGDVGGAGDPEVDDARPVVGQQHVRRLEVAVHHAVDRGEGLGEPT